MHEFFRFKSFIRYQRVAKTKYYLHSPFVYQFYLNVLEGPEDENLKRIARHRTIVRNNQTDIELTDLGTRKHLRKKVAVLESTVAVRHKYGKVLYRLVKYFQPNSILELGTSIGLSSAYMALAQPQTAITTLEGAAQLTQLAKNNYRTLDINNIDVVVGDFSETIPNTLKKIKTVDMVFFDGNHRKEATLHYFNLCLDKTTVDSVFIFDDIHWSSEMNEAWNEIKAHSQITLALDIFQFGICFFKKEKLAKEEFVLRY